MDIPGIDLPDLTSHLLTAAAGAGSLVLSRLFKQVSGVAELEGNTPNILRHARTNAELRRVMESHPDIGSIFFANTDRAHIYRRGRNGLDHGAFSLDKPFHQRRFQESKASLRDPDRILYKAQHPERRESVSGACRKAAEIAARGWPHPRQGYFQKWLRRYFQKQAENVNQAMLECVRVLADDTVRSSADLTGACHLALKWTDEDGIAHIVVMPTTDQEWKVVEEMKNGGADLPSGLTGLAVIEKIAALHAPDPETAATPQRGGLFGGFSRG